MVVVVEAEEEEQVSIPSTSSKTTPNLSKNPQTSNVKSNDDSDGYETASERGVSDNEEENKEETISKDQQQQLESNQNDDELKKREEEMAIEKANEAKTEGNKLFGVGKYEEALIKYDFALEVVPETDIPSSVELRSICHSNRGVCFLKLGKYEDTIKECTKALELNSSYIKTLIRRGEAHEKLEHFEEAIADLKKILELDPSNYQAKKAIQRLEPLAAMKREKMKEEMIGKLKELGNSVLGRFGMSVDNFKAVQDPNTGSYSISFQR